MDEAIIQRRIRSIFTDPLKKPPEQTTELVELAKELTPGFSSKEGRADIRLGYETIVENLLQMEDLSIPSKVFAKILDFVLGLTSLDDD